MPSVASPARRAEAEGVVGPAADLASIRRTLAHYEHAYEALDAQAAAAIWPSLDVAALSRAFDGLKSQSLSFDRCTFTLGYQSAIATCSGTTTVLPRVGTPSPIVESLRWTFALHRNTTGWQIESIKTAH